MFKSSSADSGVATLLHCKPSSLCSSRDMISTPSPRHVLDNRHDPTFVNLDCNKHGMYAIKIHRLQLCSRDTTPTSPAYYQLKLHPYYTSVCTTICKTLPQAALYQKFISYGNVLVFMPVSGPHRDQ